MFKNLNESNSIFNEEDYQTFSKQNWESIRPEIMSKRHEVLKKLHSTMYRCI